MTRASDNRNRTSTEEIPDPAFRQLEANKLRLLSAMDILRDLPEEEVSMLVDRSPMHTVRKGMKIYGPDGPEVLFLLKSGQVELYRQSPDGRRLTIAIVEAHTFFGEMSLIGLELSGTHAQAREDSVICLLSRKDVESLMLEYPIVAIRIVEALARRLQESRVSLQGMAFDDLTGRVASLLLNLAGEDIDMISF